MLTVSLFKLHNEINLYCVGIRIYFSLLDVDNFNNFRCFYDDFEYDEILKKFSRI